MSRALFTAVVILSAMLWLSVERNRVLSVECSRLESNQMVYLDSMRRYRTESGQWAVSTEALRLRCDELESLLAERARIIDQLKIKIRRIEQFVQTSTQTQVVFKERLVHDTIFAEGDCRSFVWRDPWCRVEGEIENDSVACKIETCDTLHQVVHRVPRRFLFFRFGTKSLRQEILCANPNSRIVWNQYIKIEKPSRRNRY
ncbi:MAG: hypothetical protein IKT28_02610 [Rikenellaceae bacterium]|nr:hypothetical protein [Rikenellaceae bacterium]